MSTQLLWPFCQRQGTIGDAGERDQRIGQLPSFTVTWKGVRNFSYRYKNGIFNFRLEVLQLPELYFQVAFTNTKHESIEGGLIERRLS
jgi:hypothetical protein